jgi:hypothetical protein
MNRYICQILLISISLLLLGGVTVRSTVTGHVLHYLVKVSVRMRGSDLLKH